MRLSHLVDAAHDPAGLDDVNVGVDGGIVVWEVDCLRDDVGVGRYLIYASVGSKGYVLCLALSEKVV